MSLRLLRPARQRAAETLRDLFRDIAPRMVVDWHTVVDDIIAAVHEDHEDWVHDLRGDE